MTNGISSVKQFSEKEIKNRLNASLEASRIIGLKWLDKYCGDFSDNAMDSEPILRIVKLIEQAKTKVKPELVITHYPEDLNIDHQIVSSATLTAFRPKQINHVKIISFEVASATDYAIYKKIFKPNYFVDVKKF